ncbi:MAG: hypothetical protein JSS82_12535 [Bacteroidetes bacterium]|nr:hypothetical protein [Bacteroidota bacterium]
MKPSTSELGKRKTVRRSDNNSATGKDYQWLDNLAYISDSSDSDSSSSTESEDFRELHRYTADNFNADATYKLSEHGMAISNATTVPEMTDLEQNDPKRQRTDNGDHLSQPLPSAASQESTEKPRRKPIRRLGDVIPGFGQMRMTVDGQLEPNANGYNFSRTSPPTSPAETSTSRTIVRTPVNLMQSLELPKRSKKKKRPSSSVAPTDHDTIAASLLEQSSATEPASTTHMQRKKPEVQKRSASDQLPASIAKPMSITHSSKRRPPNVGCSNVGLHKPHRALQAYDDSLIVSLNEKDRKLYLRVRVLQFFNHTTVQYSLVVVFSGSAVVYISVD